MDKLMIIFTVILLVSCNEAQQQVFLPVIYEDVLYIGDSNCIGYKIDTPTAQMQAQIETDCKGFRELVEYPDQLPEGFRIIFLALGTNDEAHGIPIEDYTESLKAKLESTDSLVYCVLPSVAWFSGYDVSRQRAAMIEHCEHTVDPIEYGVLNGQADGVHWTSTDHDNFLDAILSRI